MSNDRKLFYFGLGIFLLPLALAVITQEGAYTFYGFITTPIGVVLMIFAIGRSIAQNVVEKQKSYNPTNISTERHASKYYILAGVLLGFVFPFIAGMILSLVGDSFGIFEIFIAALPIFSWSGLILIIYGTFKLFRR
jgi:hypothetical protein